MLEKSSFTKVISKFKGGDSVMKKVLGLCLMVVLLASMSFAAISTYSYSTQMAGTVPGDGGNKTNGCVVYNPDLNAVFVGQYFTGAGSRACILGWTMDNLDPLYASNTPKYFIRNRMFANGYKVTALKSIYGSSAYYNNSLYFIGDRYQFDNLNMVGREFCAVNADSVSVTFPNVDADRVLYNVTGVSTAASTIVEDTWGGAQLYAGATTAFHAIVCEANGFKVQAGGAGCALVGVTGIWTDAYTAYTRASTTSSDNTTVFAPKTAIRAVTGVWTNATGAGVNFYTGPGNLFDGPSGRITLNQVTTLPTPAGGDSVWVSYGWAGIDNQGTPTGVGTNFGTGAGYDEAPRMIWTNVQIPGAPTSVYVQYSLGQFDPYTGVIKLNPLYPQPAGNLLFTHVGQLQPGMRSMWKYNATTLAAETGFGIFGVPAMYVPSTIFSIITSVAGATTGLEVQVPPAYPITDQFLVTRIPGGDCAKSRLIYADYGVTTTGPWTMTTNTQFTANLGGKPYYGMLGVYTDAGGLGFNFLSRRTCAEWVPVTNTSFAQCPWGWVDSPRGIYTNANRAGFNFFVGTSTTAQIRVPGTAIAVDTVTPSAGPLGGAEILAVAGVYTDAGGAGRNFAANAAYTREALTSADGTTVNISWLPLTAVTGCWTDSTSAGFNFYTAPGNKFTAAGVITLNTTTTLSGAVPVWVSYSGGTAASIVLPTSIKLNGNALPGIVPVWISYTPTDVLSQIAGGVGGYWDIRDKIYAWTGGIDTTLSLGSAFVEYSDAPTEQFNAGYFNVMDTTGIINLRWQLPIGTPVWFAYNRGNGLDVANNRIRVGAPAANTPLVSVGDTVYTSLLYQGGTNPYNYTGAGTAKNRSVTWNPYGLAFNGTTGEFVTVSLFSYYGWYAYDASGNLIARYPVIGSRSQVTRGQISIDQLNGDVYWADGNGVVWRWKKTGAGMDSYVQEYTPFYLGAVAGTTGAVPGGTSPGVRVKTVNGVSVVYIPTPKDNNATNPELNKYLTVMRTNGTIDGQFARGGLGFAARGIDVTPDGTKVMIGGWAGSTGYGQVMVFTGTVPVELSRFESVVE